MIIDHSRKKLPLIFDDIKEKEVSIRLYNMEDTILNNLEIKEVIKSLDTLDDKYKQVIIMRYVNDLSPIEIAQVLHVSANAVSVRINYATKKLKEITKRPPL